MARHFIGPMSEFTCLFHLFMRYTVVSLLYKLAFFVQDKKLNFLSLTNPLSLVFFLFTKEPTLYQPVGSRLQRNYLEMYQEANPN
jgi:hypothetical protein